jgi:hypothetical protein
VCLHGVTKKIVSDRGTQFTSRFWQKLHKSMDTKLNFCSTYHPQTDGQTERTNQVLEDMLRACTLKHGGSWDKSLLFAEFSYNNSVAEPPELFQLKCTSHRYTADTNSTHFKRNNSLVCRVSVRCNHGSTGSKQVYLA